MMERNTKIFIQELKPIAFCGKIIGYEGKASGYELPFEIEPTEGDHNFNNCERCKENLNEITKRLKERFKGNHNIKPFPFCCTHHENLLKFKEFNRASFANVPGMVARKLIYTNQHIINNYSVDNWYKVITDYIEWTIESFGQMPTDCGEPIFLGEYFYHIQTFINKNNDISIEKRSQILEFLESYLKPKTEQVTDLNILITTYEKWFNIFPFELNSYFGDLKQYFEKNIPILNGKPEVNPYTGLAKAKVHTKSSLIEALINLTNDILTKINGVTLYEKGLITDSSKIRLELLINNRKLKIKEGYTNNSTREEQQYGKILKEWFNDEKEFIDEITPLLKPSLQLQMNNRLSNPKSFEELFYNSQHAEPCLDILRELEPPVIDAINSYIGKNKGVIPLWLKVLKNNKPNPIIRHCSDVIYKDLLNQKIKGLNLSRDASEFRKQYTRLKNDNTELDIKSILSQFSQSGKLGK
ncbi:MAG: hypothetical protein WKF97_19485 [Chitinophagaceae bacterium]